MPSIYTFILLILTALAALMIFLNNFSLWAWYCIFFVKVHARQTAKTEHPVFLKTFTFVSVSNTLHHQFRKKFIQHPEKSF